ncbi:MAG: Hpt domain-containing protein [Proteobacteria bacterium]|nr:Hpt domain-containing protein [Pseudomonadota bacterium]
MTEPAAAIDLDRLDRLRALIGDDAFHALVDNLVADLARRIDALARLDPAADRAALAREAHTLKGTVGSYGLIAVSELAGRLEAACAGGASGAIAAAVAALDAGARSSTRQLTARFPRARGG